MAGLALLGFAAAISAETVINYDDGSTYTLTEGEEIYISKGTLFTRRILNNKDTFFTAQDPWTSRDYVPEPQDPFQPGLMNGVKLTFLGAKDLRLT